MTTTFDLGVEKVGQRIYVTGNTYPFRAKLKQAGCHWDGQRKQWWIGASKEAEIRALVATPAECSDEGSAERSLDDCSVYGKVSYTSNGGNTGTYYVIGESGRTDTPRVRLTDLAGKIDFWVDLSAVSWVKRYSPREERGAYGRPTGRTRYQTLGGLRRFVERSRRADQRGDARCAECNQPGELVRDMEDGLMKHRRCCDMPS